MKIRRQLRRLVAPHCQRTQIQEIWHFNFWLLWRNFFGGLLFQVCAGTQCELKEVCREEQRKVARKVNISTCFQVCKTEEKKL